MSGAYLRNLPQVPDYEPGRYAVGKADAGWHRGKWVVIRLYDGSVAAEAFDSRREADARCAHLNQQAAS